MGRTSNRKLFEHLIYLLRTLHSLFIMKITLIILSITIIAIQAVPVPKEEDVDQFTAYPRRQARDLNDEKLAKQSSVKDDFDLDQAEADPRKIDKSEGRRYKRSPPLVEMDSELLAKHTSGSDYFDLGEEDYGYARVNSKDYQDSREKRSPVAPLVELTSELLARHTSGSDYSDHQGEPRRAYPRLPH